MAGDRLVLVGEVLVTREIIARRRVSFAEQDALLDDVMRRYRVVRVRMDQTGMGEKPVEDAKRRHGESRVEGVLFTGAASHHNQRMYTAAGYRITPARPEQLDDRIAGAVYLHKPVSALTGRTS